MAGTNSLGEGESGGGHSLFEASPRKRSCKKSLLKDWCIKQFDIKLTPCGV